MLTATTTDILLRARRRADAETTTESEDFSTDTELLGWLNESGRRMVDEILNAGGSDLLVTSATLTSPSYTLPTDFYRPLAIEQQVDGRWETLEMVPFHERNHDRPLNRPGYRIGSALTFFPSNHTLGSVRLWYVPHFATLTSGQSLASFGGWDDFVVFDVAMAIVLKEDRDASSLVGLRNEARDRLRASVSALKQGTPERVANVALYDEHLFDFRWHAAIR